MFWVPLSWPSVQQPGAFDYIVLLLLMPLGVAAVIAFLVLAPTWRRSLEAERQPAMEVVRHDS